MRTKNQNIFEVFLATKCKFFWETLKTITRRFLKKTIRACSFFGGTNRDIKFDYFQRTTTFFQKVIKATKFETNEADFLKGSSEPEDVDFWNHKTRMIIRATEVIFFKGPLESQNLCFPKVSKGPFIFQWPSEPPIVDFFIERVSRH